MCSSTKELGEGHASFLFESNSSGGAYENPPLLVIGCTPSLGRHANIDVKEHKDIHIQLENKSIRLTISVLSLL